MIKYTILYKNGKTWNGRANGILQIKPIDCVLMAAHKPSGYTYLYHASVGGLVFFEELLTDAYNGSSERTPNPKSKTKKQKAFDEAYNDWATRVVLSGRCTNKEEWSIKAYKKWLYEQKQEKHLTEVVGALPEYKVALYTNTDKQDDDGWITWNGGEMPVPKGTMVHVKYRDGDETICSAGIMGWEEGFEGNVDGRSAVNWKHPHNSIWDIVAYKLYEDPKKVTFIKPIKTTYTFWLGAFGEIND